MKKLFISTIVLMGVFFLTNCGGEGSNPTPTPAEDTSPPVIILPTDASPLVIDLGDKDAVMKDVKARDDEDGWITSIELIADLDAIGETEVEYVVFDKAKNKTTAKRTIKIRSGKLAKEYWVELEGGGSSGETDISVAENETFSLRISDFHFKSTTATCVPDGKGTLKIREFTGEDLGLSCKFSGNAKYEKVGDTYNIVSFEYTANYLSGTEAPKTYSFTCRPK